MKKLMGFVVIIAALVLGGYYGMGLVTERTLKKNIASISQSNGLTVGIVQYDRGWFKSKAELSWSLHIPEYQVKHQDGSSTTKPAQDFTVQMPLVIYHGPIILSDAGIKFGLGFAHSDVAMPASYKEKFSSLFATQSTEPRLVLALFVNYLNSSRLELSVPNFKLIAKQGVEQFEWDGMDTSFHVSSNLKDIEGDSIINGIRFIKDKIKVTLSKVKGDYELHQKDFDLYVGEGGFSLPSLIVEDNDQKIFDLELFNLRSKSDIVNSLFEHYSKASFDKLTTKDKTYGPAIFEIAIKNIDASVLAELNEQIAKIQQGSDGDRQRALLSMLPQLPKLLSKGAQFEISKLSLVVPEGVVEGSLQVSLPKEAIGNPFQLIQKVQGNAKLRLPDVVIKSFIMASVKQHLLNQSEPTEPNPSHQIQASPSDKIAAPLLEKSSVPASESAHTQQAENSQSVLSEKPMIQAANNPQAPTSDKLPENGLAKSAMDHAVQTTEKKPLTQEEVEQQAAMQTDKKISALLQAGLLTTQGSEYVIEVTLQQGQLLVNGKPFNPAMIQF